MREWVSCWHRSASLWQARSSGVRELSLWHVDGISKDPLMFQFAVFDCKTVFI